ncbi:MAG: hypothetical protein EB165_07750 [Euryarchaeota archaeon]|nr:hypothetical protein [Euryarchaeota archaeon]
MSEFSESISDAYFTHPESVAFVHGILAEAGWLEGSILEPCCGAGYLIEGLDNVTAWDLHQYEHPLDRVGNFLEQEPESFDLVLTNPPFGWLGGLACDILNHGTKFADRVAIILPQCFRKVQRIDRINPYFHPVGDYNLPNETYILPDGQEKYVRTCFQMWERRDYKRKKFGNTSYEEFFTQVPKDEAEYYLRTQGSTAGRILDGFAYPDGRPYNNNTGRWLRGSEDLLKSYDWTKVARFASGAPSIGLHDIAWGLRSPNIEEYLVHGIMHDLINGVYDQRGGVLPI